MSIEDSNFLKANRRVLSLAAGAALVLITLVAHYPAVNGSWLGDDMQQITVVKDHPLLQLFFSPEAWRSFTKYFFTPFLAFQYQLDVWLFGYNPRYFLWHNLIDLAAVTVFTFYLWSRRFPPLLAFLACAGFVLAMPVYSLSIFLHSRHYIAGLFFVIASIHLHQSACRNGMTRNLLASAALFFMALACKELYAMVLAYFVLRSWRTPAFRKTLLFYPLALAIFAAWRWVMLGGFVGAYDYGGPLLDRLRALACIHRAIFGSDIATAICLGAIACVMIYHRLLDFRRTFHFVVLLVVAYAPLLFATFILYDFGSALRLAFFPVWLFFAAIAYVATLLWEKGRIKTAVAVLIGFLAVTTAFSARRLEEFRDVFREEIAQGVLIRNGGPTEAFFLSPRGLSSVNANIHRRLTELDGRTPANVIASMDDVAPGIASYRAYDRGCRCMRRLSQGEVQESLATFPKVPSENAPLAMLATFQSRRGAVSLNVAPDDGGSMYFVTVPGMITSPWNAADTSPMRMPTERMDWTRVRVYRASRVDPNIQDDGQDGRNLRVAFTPFLQIPRDGTVQWSRGVFLAAQAPAARRSATCHAGAPAQQEMRLAAASPLEIGGWLEAPSDVGPDAVPYAALDGQGGQGRVAYVANLYREPKKDVAQEAGRTRIGVRILDADLGRVLPGTYRLRLGIADASCDTGATLVISR